MARKTVHDCTICFRNKPIHSNQVMGQLPSDRVNPCRPFFVSGLDYAGPIVTLVNKGRERKTNKSCIALFICFVTKSIHLEAVSDLTSVSFIASLHRFLGRRGCPQRIYSDNGTNFVRANSDLKEFFKIVTTDLIDPIYEFCSPRNIEWNFIPPSSPHMGGLWEAGVKSYKHHLKRVIGNTLLTFEELTTVLVQIEACLNSRPLCQLPATPLDLQPLTPGHFLTGSSLTALPDPHVLDLSINRLNRWQVVPRITQDFWKRWSSEYLTSLHGRSKWSRDKENLSLDDIVLINDQNLSPLQWKLGKIVKLYPGVDGRMRVVDVQTSNNVLKRPIVKLCKLPINDC